LNVEILPDASIEVPLMTKAFTWATRHHPNKGSRTIQKNQTTAARYWTLAEKGVSLDG